MTKKTQRYSTEFKAETVKEIADNNANLNATAQQLEIAMQTLSNWQNKTNQGKLVAIKTHYTEVIAALEQIKQLKWKL